MPRLRLPPKVAEALGEETAAEFAQWAAETFALRDQSVHRDGFRELLSRLNRIEHELALSKERLEAIETRLDFIR